MRLALYHNHPSGGAARAIYELGRRLACRHEIDVFTLASADEGFLDSRDYAREVRVFPYATRSPIRRGLYLNEVRRYRDLDDLEAVSAQVAAAIDEGGYDAVLASACRYVETPSVLAHLKTKAAYYCHEPPRRFVQGFCRPEAVETTPYQRLRRAVHWPAETLLDRRMAALDQRNCRAAGVVLANSEFTRATVRDYYGLDARVSYLGVDSARFTPAEARGAYLLSVGTIENHKGHDFLVRAVGRLPADMRPRLVIAGNEANPALRRRLPQLAAAQGVDLDLRVGVPPREIHLLYQSAKAFVYAPREEPFGLAALEAMACGLPVVAVGEGGVLETVVDGETGLLTPRDEEAFAAALGRVLSDQSLASRLGASGRAQAESRWSWEAAAERLEGHLAELAG